MSNAKHSREWTRKLRAWVWVLCITALSGLNGRLQAQTGAGATYGTLEVTSGLGRKLYALPDDQSVIDARKTLAAEPKNVERVLALSKAEANRRQYREAVATSTPLSFNTVTYGVGNWRLYHGDRAAATDLFRKVVEGEAWNSWGFIGSETELLGGRR